jgi:hypothetical protein
MAKRSKRDFDHPDAVKARQQAIAVIDAVDPLELVYAIKRAPSLRGMIAGYIAEEMFEKHANAELSSIQSVEKHDDHDRSVNKSDRTITYKGRRYTIQLKSVQTNSIHFNADLNCLVADVQNDASDSRAVSVPGSTEKIITTCYVVKEFDILAVPLFPFTGKWNYAYKRNRDCRRTTSDKYPEAVRPYLLATTEKIYFPLNNEWTDNIFQLLDATLGLPVDETTASPEEVAAAEKGKAPLKIEE